MENEKIQMKPKQRVAYIDALRGFTMFLVVHWHVMALSFGISAKESIVGSFFLTFRMPMFFFISGLLGYKAVEALNIVRYKSLIKKKSFVQLVPTFIFFCLCQIVNNSSPFDFFQQGLIGYWFTLALFELFVIQYTISLIFGKLNKPMGGGNFACCHFFNRKYYRIMDKHQTSYAKNFNDTNIE